MTCRVYVGEYQDRITGAAATAYVVIDENGRLVKAMAQKVKTNKGLSLQAVKLAVQGLCYLHGMDEAMLCMDSPTALAALRQECPPKGSRRKITEIRHRLAAIPYPVTLELAKDLSEIREIIKNQRSNVTIAPPENTQGMGNHLG